MTLQILKAIDHSKNDGVINEEFSIEEKEVAEILAHLDELIFLSDNKGVISGASLPLWNCKRKRSACRSPSSKLQPTQQQQHWLSTDAARPSTMEVKKTPSPIPLTPEAQAQANSKRPSHLQPTEKKQKSAPIKAVQPSILENSLPCSLKAQPWTYGKQRCRGEFPLSLLQPIRKQQLVPIEAVQPSTAEPKVFRNSTPPTPAPVQVPVAHPISGEDISLSIPEMERLLLHRVPNNKIFKSNEKLSRRWFSKYQHNAAIHNEITKLSAYYHNLKAVNSAYKSLDKKLMKDNYLEGAKVLDLEKDKFKNQSKHSFTCSTSSV